MKDDINRMIKELERSAAKRAKQSELSTLNATVSALEEAEVITREENSFLGGFWKKYQLDETQISCLALMTYILDEAIKINNEIQKLYKNIAKEGRADEAALAQLKSRYDALYAVYEQERILLDQQGGVVGYFIKMGEALGIKDMNLPKQSSTMRVLLSKLGGNLQVYKTVNPKNVASKVKEVQDEWAELLSLKKMADQNESKITQVPEDAMKFLNILPRRAKLADVKDRIKEVKEKASKLQSDLYRIGGEISNPGDVVARAIVTEVESSIDGYLATCSGSGQVKIDHVFQSILSGLQDQTILDESILSGNLKSLLSESMWNKANKTSSSKQLLHVLREFYYVPLCLKEGKLNSIIVKAIQERLTLLNISFEEADLEKCIQYAFMARAIDDLNRPHINSEELKESLRSELGIDEKFLTRLSYKTAENRHKELYRELREVLHDAVITKGKKSADHAPSQVPIKLMRLYDAFKENPNLAMSSEGMPIANKNNLIHLAKIYKIVTGSLSEEVKQDKYFRTLNRVFSTSQYDRPTMVALISKIVDGLDEKSRENYQAALKEVDEKFMNIQLAVDSAREQKRKEAQALIKEKTLRRKKEKAIEHNQMRKIKEKEYSSKYHEKNEDQAYVMLEFSEIKVAIDFMINISRSKDAKERKAPFICDKESRAYKMLAIVYHKRDSKAKNYGLAFERFIENSLYDVMKDEFREVSLQDLLSDPEYKKIHDEIEVEMKVYDRWLELERKIVKYTGIIKDPSGRSETIYEQKYRQELYDCLDAVKKNMQDHAHEYSRFYEVDKIAQDILTRINAINAKPEHKKFLEDNPGNAFISLIKAIYKGFRKLIDDDYAEKQRAKTQAKVGMRQMKGQVEAELKQMEKHSDTQVELDKAANGVNSEVIINDRPSRA